MLALPFLIDGFETEVLGEDCVVTAEVAEVERIELEDVDELVGVVLVVVPRPGWKCERKA